MSILDNLFGPPSTEKVEKWKAKGNVQALIKALHNGQPYVRKSAAEALGTIRDPRAIQSLIEALKVEYFLHDGGYDKGYAISKAAASALVKMAPSSIEPLISALDGSSKVDDRAAAALTEIGEPAVESLILALKSGDSRKHYWSIKTLGNISDSRAIEPLITMFKNSDAVLRIYIVEALGNIGDQDTQTMDLLITALSDMSEDVREYATIALAKIENPQAIKPLILALKDSAAKVRCGATRALGKIGGSEAIEPLADLLIDSHHEVREEAARILKITSIRTLQLCMLPDNINPHNELNIAITALKTEGEFGSAALVQFINELLDCRSRGVIWALLAASEAKATPELIGVIESIQYISPIRAGKAGRFTPEITGNGEIGWTDETFERVRTYASEALEALSKELR